MRLIQEIHSVAACVIALSGFLLLLVLPIQSASGFQLLDPPAGPFDPVERDTIRELLIDQWELSPSNASAAAQTFQDSRSKSEFLKVVYVVNRIQQNQIRSAKSIAEDLTNNYRTNLDGWMFKTWLNTLENNYDTALINMRAFKQQVEARQDLPPATQAAIFKRLGRLVGYMQGPVSNRVNPDILQGTIMKVADGLEPALLDTFNESREQVLKAYDDLQREQAAKSQVELAKVQAENEQERISLENQNASLEQSESRLMADKERVRTEAAQQVSNLERQASSIQNQLNNISGDIRATQLNLQYLYADLLALNRQAQNGFYVSTYYLRNQIQNAEYAIAAMRNEGNLLSNQLGSARAQIARIQNGVRQQLQSMEKERKRINGSFRRNAARLAKIARGPEMADGKKSAMLNRITALQTYDELSVELYRQQVLNLVPAN